MLLLVGAALLTLLFSLVLLFSSDSGLLPVHRMRGERDMLRERVRRLELEKRQLEQQIERLEEADSFTIEEEARRKGMIREGEEVYRIKYKPADDSGSVKQEVR